MHKTLFSLMLSGIFMPACLAQSDQFHATGMPTKVRFNSSVPYDNVCEFNMDGITYFVRYNDATTATCNEILYAAWTKSYITASGLNTSSGRQVISVESEFPGFNWNQNHSKFEPSFIYFNTHKWRSNQQCQGHLYDAGYWENVSENTMQGSLLCNMMSLMTISPSSASDIELTHIEYSDRLEVDEIELLFDDAYEHNDSRQEAENLVPNKRKWLSEYKGEATKYDDDWYKIKVEEGENRIIVACNFSHDNGDIDISLHDARGNTLASSAGVDNHELIDYNVSNIGTYFIRAYYHETGNPYNLYWNATNDDAYEDNDSRQSAYATYLPKNKRLSDILGKGTQSDEDWYKIYVDKQQNLLFSAFFKHREGDIDLELYAENGNLLFSSLGMTDNEQIKFTAADKGTYYLRLYYGNKGNRYDLRWSDEDTYEEFSKNDQFSSAYVLPSDFVVSGWLYGPGIQKDDDWYRFTINESCKAVLNCTFRNAEGDIDIELYNSNQNLLGHSRMANVNSEIIEKDLGPGTYYFRVYGDNHSNFYDFYLLKM